MWGNKRCYLPLSSPLAGLLSFHLTSSPEELLQDGIPNAMVWVAGEGDGDSVASAPLNLFHPMKVLRSRGEKGNPTCKANVFNQWHGVRHSALNTVLLLSRSNCSLVTWEPIGHCRAKLLWAYAALWQLYVLFETYLNPLRYKAGDFIPPYLIVYKRPEEGKNIWSQFLVFAKKKKKKERCNSSDKVYWSPLCSLLVRALISDQRTKYYKGGKKSSVKKHSAGLQAAAAAYQHCTKYLLWLVVHSLISPCSARLESYVSLIYKLIFLRATPSMHWLGNCGVCFGFFF